MNQKKKKELFAGKKVLILRGFGVSCRLES